MGFPGGSDGKEPASNTGYLALIPDLGRCPGGGQGININVLVHFLNCHGFILEVFFLPLLFFLFTYGLMSIFSVAFGLLFPFCVHIYCSFRVCSSHELLV